MAYVTQSEVESFTGYTYTDFKAAGVAMTSNQWATFISSLISGVEGAIHRFCRVPTFAVATYTEYHDGRGHSGDRIWAGQRGGQLYTEYDRTIFPREQPVTAVTSVSEDTGYPGPIVWTVRTARSTLIQGDYQVVVDGSLTGIRFHNNIPRKGQGNIKIEYTAGNATTSDVIVDIKLIELEFVRNYLAQKKRDQEAQAARREPTRDAAEMIKELHPDILSKDIKARLAGYQRLRTGSRMWK